MQRRTILATAGAVAVTVVAGTAAVAANVGLLDSASGETIGELSPVTAVSETSSTTTAPPEIETVIVDEPVPGTARAPGGDGATGTGPAASSTPTAPEPESSAQIAASPGQGSPSGGGHHDDESDDDHEDEQHDEDDEDDDHEEYEGGEDDD